MSKQNDLILNILENPQMSIEDFQKVGFSADNTSLENEDVYIKSKVITENPLFQNSSGNFDKVKFHNFYLAAAKGMNQINTQPQDFEAVYSKYNIFAPVEQRDMNPTFELVKFENPDRITRSMLSVGMVGPREFTPQEIAQSQKVFDSKTGKWIDSPEDMFSFNKLFSDFSGFIGDNFGSTKVMAQYDEDIDINGKKRGEFGFDENNIAHSKGEYMLNENGTYYYRTLNDNENIYGKQVLHYSDILTRENSALNSIDFLDSDDIQKSTFGSFVKNASLIGAMFLPFGIGEAIAGATIFQQAAGLGATLGKIALGSDNSTMNWIEGLAEATNPMETRSEYSRMNTWTIENLLGTVGDVVGQLRQQRLLFKYSPMLFKGKWGTSAENQKLLQENIFKDLKSEYKGLLDKYQKGSLQYAKAQAQLQTLDLKAAKMVEDYMKDYYKYGEELSKAYMTLLTVNDIYGEAKQAGAQDFDAALITSGYAAMEYALLSTDIGKWILPELRAQRLENKAILKALTKDVRDTFAKLGKEASTSEEAKRTYLQKLVDFGKSIAKGEFAVGLGKRASLEGGTGLLKSGVSSVFAGGLAEAVEETSEEVLADFSKVLYNGLEQLQGKSSRMTPFENMFDRYSMSFLGGFLGGGISSAAFDFSDIRRNINMTSQDAMQKIIYKARNNDLDDLYEILNDTEVANKNLSASKFDKDEEGNLIWKSAEGNDNQDFRTKQTVKRLLSMIQNTLDAHGGNMPDSEIIDAQILRDLRYRALSNTTTAGYYIQKYNNLVSDLINKNLKLKELDTPAVKANAGESDKKDDINPDLERQREALRKEIQEIDKEIDDFNQGKLAPLFMTSALLESTPYILSPLMQSTFKEFAEKQTNTEFNKIPEAQLKELQAKYFNYLKTDKKDDLQVATDRYLKLQNMLGNSLNELQEVLRKQGSNPEILELMSDFSTKIQALEFVESDSDTWMEGLQQLASESQYAGKFLQQQLTLLKNTAKELKETYDQKLQEYTKSLSKEVELIKQKNQEAFEKGLIDEETLRNSNIEAQQEANNKEHSFEEELDKQRKETFSKNRQEILLEGQLQQANELADKLISLGYISGAIKDKIFSHLDGILATLEEYNSTLDLPKSDWGNIEMVESGGIDWDTMNQVDPTLQNKYENYKYSQETLTPAIEEFKNKINQVKSLKYTPVLNDLNKFVLSINGIRLSELLTKLGKAFNSNASNLSTFTMSSQDYNAITESEKVINLFIAALEGARTDNVDPFGTSFSKMGAEDKSNLWGINKVINEIHAKAPKIENDTWTDLPEIEGDLANMAIEDIKSILNLLQTYKKLYNYNQGQKLNAQTRVSTKATLILYDKTKRLLSNINVGDDDINEKAKAVISGFNTLEELTKGDIKNWNLNLTTEQLKQIEKERIQLEDAIYKFFQDTKLLENTELLEKFFSKDNFSLNDISVNPLTENSTTIEDSSFIGYIASLAAIKSTDFYATFKEILDGKVAPLISQELSVRLGVANIINGPIITSIIKAYRNSLINWFNKASVEERKKFLMGAGYDAGNATTMATDAMAPLFNIHDLVPQYDNLILIDGRPGTGKSAATAKLITSFIQKYKSDITENAWVIHGGDSKESTTASEQLRDAIGLSDTNPIFNRLGLLKKLSSDYVEPTEQNGEYKYKTEEYILTKDGKLIPNWKLTNTEEIPSLIVIDEVQQFTQLELILIDKFAKEHGISVICLGDTAQSQTHSSFKLEEKLANRIIEEAKKEGVTIENIPLTISLARTQLLHCPKLGTSMRTANNQKNQNMIATQVAYDTGKGNLQLHYYEDETTLAGDIITKSEDQVLQYIDKLIDLGVTKIHFATYKDTHLARVLNDNKKYKDVIEKHDGVGLGLEGDYWIIELNPDKDGYDSIMQDFYSGQTRSKKFSITVFDNTIKTPVGEINITNVKDTETHEEKLDENAINKYAQQRKNLLNSLIKDSEEIPYNPRNSVITSEVVGAPKLDKEEKEKELSELLPIPEVSEEESDEIIEKARKIVERSVIFPAELTNSGNPAELIELTGGRKIVLLDINGFKLPFYCSTGMGGKKNVQVGKWYPFLGIDPSGAWLMKGNEDQINSYYGSPALKAISELLGEKYGDVRGTITEVGKNWEELCNFINQNLIPVENGMPDTIQKIDQLITQYIPEIEARFNNTYVPILPETTEVPDEDQEVVEPEEISPFTETLDQEEVKEQINQATLETNDIDEENSTLISPNLSAKDFIFYLFSNATFELGVDPSTLDSGQIVYSEDEARIDSLNGFRKLQEVSTYKTIKEIQNNLPHAIQVLGSLRRILFSIENKSEIEKWVSDLLGVKKVYVIFGIKTSELKYGGLESSPKYGKLEKAKNEILPYQRATTEDNDASTVNNRNLVAIIGSDTNGDLIEIPLLTLNNPITIINLKAGDNYLYPDIAGIYNSTYNATSGSKGTKQIKALYAIKNYIDTQVANKADYEGFYYLLTTYLDRDRHIKFINDDKWTPVANLSSDGVDLNINRGIYSEYFKGNEDYIQTNNYIALKEFLQQPDLVVSELMRYEEKDGQITDDNGNIIKLNIQKNHPFVLYTDQYLTHDGKILNKANILEEYLWHRKHNDPNSIKLVYVLPPTFGVSEYIDSLIDFTVNKKGKPLGNQVTAFKILNLLFIKNPQQTKVLFTNAFGEDLGNKVYNKVLSTLHRISKNKTFEQTVKELTETSEAWADLSKIGIPKNIPLYRQLQNIVKQLVYPAALKVESFEDSNIRLVYDPEGVDNRNTQLPIIENILGENNLFYYQTTGDSTKKKYGFSPIKELSSETTIDNQYLKNDEFLIHGGLATSTFDNDFDEALFNTLKKESNDDKTYVDGYSGFGTPPTQEEQPSFGVSIQASLNKLKNKTGATVQTQPKGPHDNSLETIADIVNEINNKSSDIGVIAFIIDAHKIVTTQVSDEIKGKEVIFDPNIQSSSVGDIIGDITIGDVQYVYSLSDEILQLREKKSDTAEENLLLNFSKSFDDIEPQVIEANYNRLLPLFEKLAQDGDYPMHDYLEEALENKDFELISEIINDEMDSKPYFQELQQVDAEKLGLYKLNDIFMFESLSEQENVESVNCAFINIKMC